MAQPTQHDGALAFAQRIIDFTSTFDSLLKQAQAISSQQSVHNYASNLQAMGTYSINPDGTPGDPDPEPIAGNPINGLNQSFYNLDLARSALVSEFIDFATGTGTPVLDRRIKVAALLP